MSNKEESSQAKVRGSKEWIKSPQSYTTNLNVIHRPHRELISFKSCPISSFDPFRPPTYQGGSLISKPIYYHFGCCCCCELKFFSLLATADNYLWMLPYEIFLYQMTPVRFNWAWPLSCSNLSVSYGHSNNVTDKLFTLRRLSVAKYNPIWTITVFNLCTLFTYI